MLWPFAVLYQLATSLRNHLYNTGFRPSVVFEVPTVCVGNLSVGGTGKTPHIEYLLRFLLKKGYKASTLSRGYGRRTKGPIIADETASALQIGDEPMQFFRKFYPEVAVAVGEERIVAVPHLLDEHPDTEVVLLDDAYQHRKLRASFQILLTDYSRPFYKDYLLPTGMLRESRKGARRAQVIIVTKCPEMLSAQEKEGIKQKLRKYARKDAQIFFSKIQYGNPVPLGETQSQEAAEGYCLVTGIANPQPLKDYLQSENTLFKHWDFNDHHRYKPSDLDSILQHCTSNRPILLTEKDAVKWELEELKPLWEEYPVYYLPIEVAFLEGESEFQKLISRQLIEN